MDKKFVPNSALLPPSVLLINMKSVSVLAFRYCSAVGNFQVMGGFQSLHKLSL